VLKIQRGRLFQHTPAGDINSRSAPCTLLGAGLCYADHDPRHWDSLLQGIVRSGFTWIDVVVPWRSHAASFSNSTEIDFSGSLNLWVLAKSADAWSSCMFATRPGCFANSPAIWVTRTHPRRRRNAGTNATWNADVGSVGDKIGFRSIV
jgi:Glycosyl hydrolases family 35